MVTQGRGSVKVIEEQETVGTCPWLNQINDNVVKYRLWTFVPTFTSEDTKAEKVAFRGDGEQLVAHWYRLVFNDDYPCRMAFKPYHRLVYSKVTARYEVLMEQMLTLMLEGSSLLDDGPTLTTRDWRDHMKIAMKLHEAIARHQLRDVSITITVLPVMVHFR